MYNKYFTILKGIAKPWSKQNTSARERAQPNNTRSERYTPSDKERKCNKRIQTLVSGYARSVADEFLRGIVLNYLN